MLARKAGREWAAAVAALGIGLMLAGCDSARFGARGPALSARSAPARTPAAEPPPVVAMPADPVTSEPLPPPPGSPPPVASAPLSPGPVLADVPATPSIPAPAGTTPSVSGTNPSSFGGAAAVGTSRSAAIGAWTAREAAGTSCRVQLSSAPALDLYKASAAGCSNKDLARVTAWDFRDGEVYLYQPGGAVAARLRSSGGALEGVLAKSGAPLSLSRF